MKNWRCLLLGVGALNACYVQKKVDDKAQKPNVVLIYTDDVGYGDIGVYGGKVPTPNIDFLAKNGIQHHRAYAVAATCTPSRFSLLTGEYAWRKKGRGVVPGDAPALIKKGRQTVASVMKKAGYRTAVIGKWHLGLGGDKGPEWNATITNSPLEIGFDYCFLMPSTSDRVPTVLMENNRILNLDPKDPIQVNYRQKIGNWPTGKENPELLRLKPSHGHDMTITNGISRIGFQYGGASALFRDEDLADQFVEKSIQFIERDKEKPFFIMLNTNDIHVPRMPHERFQGKSGHGSRGDAILSLDETVGKITSYLKKQNRLENTIIIFSSDNGPVLDDGYDDKAVELTENHNPFGGMRGGKYSGYESGTRVPFIIYWENHIKPQVSEKLISQIDFVASLSSMANVPYDENQSFDSQDYWKTWIGQSERGRDYVIQEFLGDNLAVVTERYKYICPVKNPRKIAWQTGIETAQAEEPQLYDLSNDRAEKNNIANERPELVEKFDEILVKEKNKNKS